MIIKIVFIFIIGCTAGSVYAQNTGSSKAVSEEITPFSNFSVNAANGVLGWNILLHAGGAASTYGLVKSGSDFEVHNYFNRNKDTYNKYTLPAVYGGYAGPVLLSGGLYLTGYVNNDTETLAAGCAVMQAGFLAFSYTSLLKVFTGRPNPDTYSYTKENDRSGEFNWGFMKNGIHYGWPSGHMGVSTAVISSLIFFYDTSLMVKITGSAVWAYMAFGVLAHEGNTMHWFSDAVAGTLMGFAIGSSVGSGFRDLLNSGNGSSSETRVSVSPLISQAGRGIAVSITF